MHLDRLILDHDGGNRAENSSVFRHHSSLWRYSKDHPVTLSVGSARSSQATQVDDPLLLRYDDLKTGTCIGADKYGNRYYQNTRYFVGKTGEAIVSHSHFASFRSQSLGGVRGSRRPGLRRQSSPTGMVIDRLRSRSRPTHSSLGIAGCNTSLMIHRLSNR